MTLEDRLESQMQDTITVTNTCHYCDMEYQAERYRVPGYCSGLCRTKRSRDLGRLAKIETEAVVLRARLKLRQS